MPGERNRLLSSLAFLAACLSAVSAIRAQSTPAAAAPMADPASSEFFERRIRPILVEHCLACHGAQAPEPKGGLRLDSRAGVLRGGELGAIVVPGDPAASRLISAVRYADPNLQMPPKQRLSDEQIADLETWVRIGLPDPREGDGERDPNTVDSSGLDKAWAFEPLRMTEPPRVANEAWCQDPLDRFVLARLEERGLQHAPRATKVELLRRASFDLTGLPPRPEELDEFLADESPESFAKVVDRLLASPQYGERWARIWLDLVRYCDDLPEAWRYRDWMVRAFNQDLTYDQFMRLQVAGDLEPRDAHGAPNADGLIATTMLSLGPWTGIDRPKRLTDIVDDQLDTISRSFLGLTVACARCHDHKFDPISTADYYGLAGMFFSSRVISDAGYLSHGTTRLRIPLVAPEVVARHDEHKARFLEQSRAFERAADEAYAQQARGMIAQTSQYLLACWDYEHRQGEEQRLSVKDFADRRGLRDFALNQWLEYLRGPASSEYTPLDVAEAEFDGEPGVTAWRVRAERPWWAANTRPDDVAIETFVLPTRSISINPGTEGGVVAWISPVQAMVHITGTLTDGDPQDGTGAAWVVDLVQADGRRELATGRLPNGDAMSLDQGRNADRLVEVPVVPGDRIELMVRLGTGDAHYDVTRVDFVIQTTDGTARWDLASDVVDDLLAGNPHADRQGNSRVWHFLDAINSRRLERMVSIEPWLARWREALAGDARDVPPGEIRVKLESWAGELQQMLDAAPPTSALLRDLASERSPLRVREKDRDDEKLVDAETRARLKQLLEELNSFRSAIPTVPYCNGIQEQGLKYSLYPGIQDAPIHVRGSHEQLGDRVPRGLPRRLAGEDQPPILEGSGRRELAAWLGSGSHPLPARVIVNRLWQQHFGTGLVRTASNFGAKGDRPLHHELLDHLARALMERGWSIKALQRRILLSATWQQSSVPSHDVSAADPENRLWGRQNRRRLDAESLHDGLLALTGQLNLAMGGAPLADANTERRMLYLRLLRGDRPGLGVLFDAADPSMHAEQRTLSTVAPQALYLMNHPWVLSCAQRIANRPELAAEPDPSRRVVLLYRSILGRNPTDAERSLGLQLLGDLALDAERPAPGPAASGADLPSPLSDWELFTQSLLLSNEFLFVD